MGKNLNENEFNNFASLKDNELIKKIDNQFENTRKERIKILGEDQSKEIEKRILLQSIDLNWKSHIQYLEQLRQVIGLRQYGQKDPLSEFKKEAFNLFEGLLDKIKNDIIKFLLNLNIVIKNEDNFKALATSFIPNHDLKIPIVKVDIPKYSTAA